MIKDKRKSEAKQLAIIAGKKQYDGKICINHPNNTKRWVSNSCCIICSKSGLLKYRVDHKKELTKKRKQWDHNNPIKAMLQRCRKRAKDLGLEFNLSETDIDIPERCPILDISLNRLGNIENAPSLDRIDNTKGYINSNVLVISYKANRIKNNASLEDLRKILLFYENLLKETKCNL